MKVLIVSASPGNGHNSTAKKIENKILSSHKDAEIKTVDMYKAYGSKFKAWTMDQGYAFACNHIVGIYNHFFKKSEKNDYTTRDKCKANIEVYPMLHGLLTEIYEYKPDIIVCTYIFTAVAINNLRRVYEIPAKVVCMTLDYGISPYWESTTRLDEMFITGEYMFKPFLEKGFTKQQLIISGIPVGDEFSAKTDKEKARQKFGLENKFTVMMARSSFFSIKSEKLIKEFSKIKQPIQIIICNGKDKKGKEKLDSLILKSNLPHKFLNLGFVSDEDFALLFDCSDVLITKGGGLTLTETITKGVPPIIIDKLPQQEIYNKKYLIENGAGLGVDRKNSISSRVNFLLTNPDEYEKLKKNIKKIQKVNVLDVFLSHFEKYPKADYSNIPSLTDTKKQLINKIDKARKQAVKFQKITKRVKISQL